MSLLHNKKSIFIEKFLSSNNDIAKTLHMYHTKMHNDNTDEKLNMTHLKDICSQIQIKKSGIYPHYKEDQPQDAEEFLQFLFNEIAYCNQANSTLETETNLLYKNNSNSTELLKSKSDKEKVPIYAFTPTTNPSVVENADPTKCISLSKLINRGNVMTHTDIQVTEDMKHFDEVVTQSLIKNATYVIITIPRLTMVEPDFTPTKKTQDVIPDETITINESTLLLTSIIAHLGCHTAGHYVCFFNKEGTWFLFDSSMYGLSNEFIQIGNFSNVLSVKSGEGEIVQKCGTILIYEMVGGD